MLCGILGSIAQQIHQHLTEPQSIHQVSRMLHFYLHTEILLLLQETAVQHRVQVVQQHPKIEGFRTQTHLTAFDLRHIQNIIQQSQKIMGGALHLSQAIQPFFFGLILLQRNFCHADDAVHRCADFMRHASQEIRLGPGRQIMLLLIDAVLYDRANLAKRTVLFVILQKGRRKSQQENVSGILPVVRHG